MIGERRAYLLINQKIIFVIHKMPKSSKKATPKQVAARKKFKEGVSEYKKYKKEHPEGKKKLQTFIKEAF